MGRTLKIVGISVAARRRARIGEELNETVEQQRDELREVRDRLRGLLEQ
jgi:uncharacterized coiled-coil protein SlyX